MENGRQVIKVCFRDSLHAVYGGREAVMLKYYHGLKLRETAEVQGCPVGTVKSRLHHGLKRIGESVSE